MAYHIHFCCALQAPKVHPYPCLNCFEANQSQILYTLPKPHLHSSSLPNNRCCSWRILWNNRQSLHKESENRCLPPMDSRYSIRLHDSNKQGHLENQHSKVSYLRPALPMIQQRLNPERPTPQTIQSVSSSLLFSLVISDISYRYLIPLNISDHVCGGGVYFSVQK